MSVDFRKLTDQLERVYSRRIALREVALTDAWPLFNATRNPLFNEHLLWSAPSSDEEVLARIDSLISVSRSGRLTALCAVHRETGEWVSLFRFQPYALDPSLVEMGLWTHDKFWKGRYSLEVSTLCVDAAFELTDIPMLVCSAAPDNKGSYKLMEHVGCVPTKMVFRHHESNPEVPMQEFHLTREAWKAAKTERCFKRVALPVPALPRFDDSEVEAMEAIIAAGRVSSIGSRRDAVDQIAVPASGSVTPIRPAIPAFLELAEEARDAA